MINVQVMLHCPPGHTPGLHANVGQIALTRLDQCQKVKSHAHLESLTISANQMKFC